MIRITEKDTADFLWSVYGSFGQATEKITIDGDKIISEGEGYIIECTRKNMSLVLYARQER